MKVSITVGSKRATIDGSFPKDDIDDALSAYVKGYQFSPQFKQRRKDGSRVWDGKLRLFSRVTNSFPVGVLDIVCDILKKNKIVYDLHRPYLDELDLPEDVKEKWISGQWEIPDQVGPFILHDYQKQAIKTFFDPTRSLPYRGIIRIATSGGKTAVGATIAKIVNCPALILIHGKKLTRQNLDVFKQVFQGEEDKIGVIDSNNWNPSLVTIASSDTLFSRMKNLDYEDKLSKFFDGIILTIADECHRASSKSFADILKAINAPMRLGLSATPNKKEDDRDLLLHSLTGDIIYEMGVSELKKKGTISKAHLLCVIIKEPTGFEELDWQEAFTSLIINNGFRHEIIAKLVQDRIKNNRTVLVLAGNSLDNAENIYKRIIRYVSPEQVRLVNGLSQDAYVDDSFKKLQSKELSCVTTTTIADEGIDIPSVNTLILAGGGKCLGKSTLILLYNGKLKKVEDIVVGDLLMGPDSKPRKVLKTVSGRDNLYHIMPNKGKPFICTEDHLLTINDPKTKNIIDISVNDYFNLKSYKHYCTLFIPNQIEFPKIKEPIIDPYFLGIYFGDGTKNLHKYSRVSITTMDNEIKQYCEKIARIYNLNLTKLKSCHGKANEYALSNKDNTNRYGSRQNKNNKLLTDLLSIVGESFIIPDCIKYGSIETRKQFLAGFIDTDGYLHHGFYEISQVRKDYADDIMYIANSIGLRTTCRTRKVAKSDKLQYRINILGEINKIPCKLLRKQAQPRKQIKDSKRTGFKVGFVGHGEYYGFELDGDGRFLLGDFTVTHNSFVRTVQRVGRSLRLKEDGSDAEIIDILDTTNPYLKKHSRARLDYYNEENLFDTAKSVMARNV